MTDTPATPSRDTLDPKTVAAIREWLVTHKTLHSLGPVLIAADFDRAFPPPAPPLPRCHWCGGKQEREADAGHLRCLSCRRRWFPRIANPTAAQLAAEYNLPLRLAEARGRVEAAEAAYNAANVSAVQLSPLIDRYRAELAALEA